MKKVYKITPFATAVALAIIGLAFILLPFGTVGIALRIVGALLLALEIYRAIPYLSRGSSPSAFLIFLLSDIFVIIFSLILLINPIGAVNMLCVIFGIYLIVSSAVELFRLSRYSSITWKNLILPVLTLIFGIFLVFYPAAATKLTFTIIGIAILVKAVDLFIYDAKSTRKTKTKKTTRSHVVTDYKDVTGKKK